MGWRWILRASAYSLVIWVAASVVVPLGLGRLRAYTHGAAPVAGLRLHGFALGSGILSVLVLIATLHPVPQGAAEPLSWLGQLLFGWLAWKSDVVPNWLSVVGMLGGVAGLLTLAVYQSPMLALVQLASFAVWGGIISRQLIRDPAPVTREWAP